MPQRCLISDNEHNPIAQARLLNTPRANPLVLEVLGGKAAQAAELAELCVIGIDEEFACRGRIVSTDGNRLAIEPLETLDRSARQHLRVPIKFQSVMYPVSGGWRGQRVFISRDLSCGGLALASPVELEPGEEFELALPVTDEPLLVHAVVLRPLPVPSKQPLYAARFVNLTDDEDALITKAVYAIQQNKR